MRGRWGVVVVIAGAMLAAHVVLTLQDQLCTWVVMEGIDPLTRGVFPVVLMGLWVWASWSDSRQHGRRAVLWWGPVARACSAAALFSAAAGLDSLPGCLFTTPDLWRSRGIACPLLLRMIMPEPRGAFLAVTIGVLAMLLKRCCQDDASPSDHQRPVRPLAGLLLLIGVVGSLWVEWVAFRLTGPGLLWSRFGYQEEYGYIGMFWYRNPAAIHFPVREALVGLLDLFAQVTLVLWCFQYLWRRIRELGEPREGRIGGPSLRGPTPLPG